MIAETPVYLNAASHGLPGHATRQRFARHAVAELEQGTLAAAMDVQDELRIVRKRAGALLNVPDAQVCLGTTTTQAWISVVSRLPLVNRRVLVAPHEWGAHVRHLLHMASYCEMVVDIVPESEAFDPQAWARRMDEDVAALVMPLVTSIEALRYPAEAIGALARPEGALLIVDAAQALGRSDIAMGTSGCDVLIGTARKWVRGPRATAMMALSPAAEKALEVSAPDLEPRDANIAARLALGVALQECLEGGIAAISARIGEGEKALRAALESSGGLPRITGRHDDLLNHPRAPGNVVLYLPETERERVDAVLDEAGILAKWANPAVEEPLSRLAVTTDLAILRFTPHIYNTPSQFEATATALRRALSY